MPHRLQQLQRRHQLHPPQQLQQQQSLQRLHGRGFPRYSVRLILVAALCLFAGRLLVDALPDALVHKAATREEMLEMLKGRYNYASFDCAARILGTNKGCKSASAILQSQKDSYLRNLCVYDDKHVILELCQDIRIDSIVVANFEYFSSMVREFTVSVSKKYPPHSSGWKVIGSFTAENSRREQVFQVTNMTAYARYVRIDFVTHHGNEYYCLLSTVRIYGKTMMEDFEESAAATGLPAKRDVGDGAQTAATGTVATVKATVVSSKPIETAGTLPSTAAATMMTTAQTRAQKQTSRPASAAAPLASEEDSPESLASSAEAFVDLLELFRRQQASYCLATATATATTEAGSDESDGAPPVLSQENVFKAIYDRLQQLERNVTRSARNLEGELRRLGGDLRYVQDELGVTEEVPNGPAASSGAKKSFRARLLHHLERKNSVYIKSLAADVQFMLDQLDKNDRLVFWIAIFGALQVAGLACLVVLGHFLGWFRSDGPRAGAGRWTHRRSRSSGDLLPHPSYIVDETTNRRVSAEIDEYRGTSPAKSDLIMTASKPLLLDETEADLIDATFVPSPLGSVDSMDFSAAGVAEKVVSATGQVVSVAGKIVSATDAQDQDQSQDQDHDQLQDQDQDQLRDQDQRRALAEGIVPEPPNQHTQAQVPPNLAEARVPDDNDPANVGQPS